MTENYNPERLIAWAQHLLFSELKNKPVKIADPAVFIPWEDGTFEFMEPFFSYIIKELVEVFPEEWVEIDEEVFWILDEDRNFVTSIQKFFGLAGEEVVKHLCVPLWQRTERFGGKILLPTASEKEIAVNIIELAYKLDSQQKNFERIYLN